jgi:hypothetical protein
MSKVYPSPKAATRARIALLSNPQSADGLAQLPRIRAFCADHPDVFHYEVEEAGQVSEAMRSIARVRPALLAINGGEPTVRAAMAELRHFEDAPAIEVITDGKLDGLRRLVERASRAHP